MKKIILVLIVLGSILFYSPSYAQEAEFSIIPKSEGLKGNEIQEVAKGGSVWEEYNQKAETLSNNETGLADQINSGIMNWDTLLDYIVYLAKFIGELGLLIAAFVLIYIGYDKAAKIFSFGNLPIGSVVKGLIVLIGAYFIVKFLYNAFIS